MAMTPEAKVKKKIVDRLKAGGISLVINEDNLDDVFTYIGKPKEEDARQLEFNFGY